MSIPIGFIETAMSPAMSVLIGALGTMAVNISTTDADPTDHRRDRPGGWNVLPMEQHAEGESGDDHVREAEVEDEAGIPFRFARVKKECEREHRACLGDSVGQRRGEDVRISVAHHAKGDAIERSTENPQRGGEERQDAEPSRRLPEKVVRHRARFPRRGLESSRRVGRELARSGCPLMPGIMRLVDGGGNGRSLLTLRLSFAE